MRPDARAARIDQRIQDLRRCISDQTALRWLSDIEDDGRALLEDAFRVPELESTVAQLRTELQAADLDRQIIADAAAMLIDRRRGA